MLPCCLRARKRGKKVDGFGFLKASSVRPFLFASFFFYHTSFKCQIAIIMMLLDTVSLCNVTFAGNPIAFPVCFQPCSDRSLQAPESLCALSPVW